MPKKLKILFFINGCSPSDEDKQLAFSFAVPVCYRNALFIDETSNPEPCDCVAGEVPDIYNAYPDARIYIDKMIELKRDLTEEEISSLSNIEAPAKKKRGGNKKWVPNIEPVKD